MDTEVTNRITPLLQQWYKEKYGRLRNLNTLKSFRIIRYADDFVIIHEREEIIAKAKQLVEEWLKGIGLGMFDPRSLAPCWGRELRGSKRQPKLI